MSYDNVKTEQPGVELTDVDIDSIPKQSGVCATVFPLDLKYATLTQVEIADDKFMTWKKYKAFTVCFPFLVRKVGDIEGQTKSVLDAMDAMDDMTACCTGGSMCLDYIAQQLIWGHAKPPMSYLLEAYAEKDGEVAKTYILKDKRTATERMCKMKIGHWSMYELGNEEDLLMKANYRRNCFKLRTHYQMKDKDDNVLASHLLRDPFCYCDCSCKGCMRMCFAPCICIGKCCSSYKPIATYMTPYQPTQEPPAYLPDYKVKEGFRLMGYSCIGLCCGKSHDAVEFPTFFTAGREMPEEEDDDDESGEKEAKKKKLDNRILVKDRNPCAKMCMLFTPSFEDLPLEGLGELGELAEMAKEVAGELSELRDDMEAEGGDLDVDKQAGQGGVKWARSKNDTYGIEYPSHFTSAQRLGMVLAALEFDSVSAN